MATAGENTKGNFIITGASGNLGSTVTSTFLDKGYRVIAVVHHEKARTRLIPHENLEIKVADLSNEKAAEELVQSAISKYGKIDGALLLAGGFTAGKIEDTGTDDIRRQVSLNFETAYHVARPLLNHMLDKNYGRLVFVGARPAIKATDGKNMVAYALSKSLLFRLAEFINAENKGKNVTATVVVPSTIDTPPNRESMPNADPSKWVKPEDLAEILSFIISKEAGALRENVIKVYNNA